VTDFGIAGEVQTPSTADGGYVRGTIHYLSPEQAAGAAVDGRSDLYSLGVTGYYALTGQLPFDMPSVPAVLVAHATKRPTPITQVARHVPPQLAAAVERCLEKQTELRWPNGEKFAEAVDAAFEAPRELPAPLRAWLARGNRTRGAAIVVGVYGSAGIGALFASGHQGYGLAAVGALATLVTLPIVNGVRRLIAAGFSLADLRGAVQTYVVRRREELEYDARDTFAMNPRRLGAISLGLFAIAGAGIVASRLVWPTAIITPAVVMVSVVGTITGILAVTRAIQLSRGSERFSLRLRFWKSKLGERLYRLASLGLKRPAAAAALPQHTEVALGRALEAIYDSLPKATRKELKDVPETVRRLEREAQKLRESIDALDAAVSAGRAAGRDADARELERQREAAAERLATTVTALETIRLGLLRLQIGAAPVSSVTAAIESATALERELEIAAAARAEVSRTLQKPR
jgi:serine/threonine-protein kinase